MNKLKKILDDYKSSNYVDVKNAAEYKRLLFSNSHVKDWPSYCKGLAAKRGFRYVWFWPGPWYKLPRSLPMKDMLSENGEWPQCHQFLKSKFPLQYFIREGWTDIGIGKKIRFWRYGLRELYWKIYRIFIPDRPELRKAIPREYRDLDVIIEDFLFACVKSYVEKELGGKIAFHNLKEVSEFEKEMCFLQNKFNKELQNCYNYTTIERPKLQKELEETLAAASKKKRVTHEEKYGKYNQLEKNLKKLDDKWLLWIVNSRGGMWT